MPCSRAAPRCVPYRRARLLPSLTLDAARPPPSPPPSIQIFRRMHAAFVDAVSNPFYSPGAPLASPRFDASIRAIAQSLGAT